MDFVHVRDVVSANMLAMESEISGETFNVGSGTSTSVAELARMINRKAGTNLEPIYEKDVKLIVQRRQADVSKIRKVLGFEPRVSLDDGLQEVIGDTALHPEFY